MIGKKVIVRCDRSGVFFGTLASLEGKQARVTNVRGIYYWVGAATLLQLAKEGVKNKRDSKITIMVDELLLTDVIEIIPCSDEAIDNLESVKEWKM